MRCIVTGASSFLGRAVTAALRDAGHDVTALRHSFEEAQTPLPARADVWFHFAWAGQGSAGRSSGETQNYNIAMSMAALRKAASMHCARFLFAGSQAEYGSGGRAADQRTARHAGSTERVQAAAVINASTTGRNDCGSAELMQQEADLEHETDALNPVSAYGKAKAAFGEAARAFVRERLQKGETAPFYVHLRIFSVYGPGDHETALIPSCIRAFRENAPMRFGACTQDWNYLYLDDAVRAVLLAAEAPEEALFRLAQRQVSQKIGSTFPARNRYFDAGSDAASEDGTDGESDVGSDACFAGGFDTGVDDSSDVGSDRGSDAGFGVGSALCTAETAAASDVILNIGGTDTRPLRNYIKELKRLMESGSPLLFGARGNNAEGAADLRPDTSALRSLGFCQSISFAEGIRRLLRA